ncbi:hypothetical protein [Parapedobacter sp. 10938]|uniref:hypothetical protein n=1 Tax=Parapedobacter flavus TaxID=3110225 RepID=UPI002DB7E1A8|nr:hypothetical protein [Parapedobacter sp. 10938]MEC3881590.1 hypothetical protein [Parapedobacter sp. 10938]
MHTGKTYGIDISFETLQLPLQHDVLILARNATQGKRGLGKSLELLAPGTFQPVDSEVGHEGIEAVFIHRRVLTKIPVERIMNVLQQHVFEHVGEGELIQVDMHVRISLSNLNS